MGGVEEAVGDRGAGHLQPRRHLRHERHHAGLRRPPRRPRARRHLHREHRRRRIQLRPHAWHGERIGDSVRASVRGQEVPHDGRVHAAFVDRALHVRRASASHVLLRGGRAAADGSVAGAVKDGRAGLRVVHPAALLVRLPLPAAAVPAVPDEELRQRGRVRRRAVHPHLRQLALHLQVPVWARGHRAHAQLLVVGHRHDALRLRLLRRVPGDVAGLLRRGVHWHVGVRQAVLGVRCHAMLGELVLQNLDPAHWKPQERGYCSRRALHLHDDQRVGDDDSTGILRGHGSASGQRARRGQREGRQVRDHRVVDDFAGDRALLLGANHGPPQQVCARLHLQLRRAERRRQSLRPPGLHHPPQQHPARPLRSGRWVRMAIHGGLRQHRLLLPHRHTHGHPPRMALQPWCAGNLGRHDRRHRRPDAHSGHHNCPLRLGKGGHDREHAHGQAVASSVMAGEIDLQEYIGAPIFPWDRVFNFAFVCTCCVLSCHRFSPYCWKNQKLQANKVTDKWSSLKPEVAWLAWALDSGALWCCFRSFHSILQSYSSGWARTSSLVQCNRNVQECGRTFLLILVQ